MSSEQLRIVAVGPERDAYLPLLSQADDSAAQVHGYYQTGDLSTLDDAAVDPHRKARLLHPGARLS